MKILFICNQNEHRSKMAEAVFGSKYQTKSAGLFNETPLTEKQLEWADVIAVMEEKQRAEVGKRFPKTYMKKRIVCLNIPDNYSFGQPELKKALEQAEKTILANLLPAKQQVL